VEHIDTGVRVQFSGGREEYADILLGGDGIRSGVRCAIMPQVQPVYAGYYIWRGAAKEADLSPRALKEVFPYFSFFLPPQQEVICYPISGFDNNLRPGHRRFNFIWYRVADAALLKQMCIDENGQQHEHSVPPPLIRKDLVSALREEAQDELPPALNDCLSAIAQPFFTPIYDFIAPRIVSGRIALIGDAASNARPHMGFGVSKAACDAQALAQALGAYDDIDEALAQYNRIRQPIGEIIVKHSRKLASLKNARRERFDFLGYSFGPYYYKGNGQWYLSASVSKDPYGREPEDRGRPRDACAASGSPRHDGLDRRPAFFGCVSMRMRATLMSAPPGHIARVKARTSKPPPRLANAYPEGRKENTAGMCHRARACRSALPGQSRTAHALPGRAVRTTACRAGLAQ